MNDTTFQGNGEITYVPVVVDAKPKPITNAMKIRAMTDEELAEWFSIYGCRNKTYDAHCETFDNCKACWLYWLRQEVKT